MPLHTCDSSATRWFHFSLLVKSTKKKCFLTEMWGIQRKKGLQRHCLGLYLTFYVCVGHCTVNCHSAQPSHPCSYTQSTESRSQVALACWVWLAGLSKNIHKKRAPIYICHIRRFYSGASIGQWWKKGQANKCLEHRKRLAKQFNIVVRSAVDLLQSAFRVLFKKSWAEPPTDKLACALRDSVWI